MSTRFEGQTAIITGGADGIGRAITEKLAAEGANVCIFDINLDRAQLVAEELAAKGVAVTCERVDIANEESVIEGFESVAEKFSGKIDVMVNCAAIVGPTSVKITEVKTEDFDQTYAINLRGTFLMTKHALLHMEPNGYGRILNFSSIAGKEGNAGMGPYSTTKAGVIGLVKTAGKEFAESGITVNAVAPAVIRTPMVEAIADEQVKYMTDKIPMKRCGSLEEIADLTCWIVSKEASFCTGFTFDMTGGRAVY